MRANECWKLTMLPLVWVQRQPTRQCFNSCLKMVLLGGFSKKKKKRLKVKLPVSTELTKMEGLIWGSPVKSIFWTLGKFRMFSPAPFCPPLYPHLYLGSWCQHIHDKRPIINSDNVWAPTCSKEPGFIITNCNCCCDHYPVKGLSKQQR